MKGKKQNLCMYCHRHIAAGTEHYQPEGEACCIERPQEASQPHPSQADADKDRCIVAGPWAAGECSRGTFGCGIQHVAAQPHPETLSAAIETVRVFAATDTQAFRSERHAMNVVADAAEAQTEALKGYARHKGTCGITLCIICNFGPIETHTPCNCTCGLSALLSEPV